jgi:hypothetical protein
LQSVTETLLSEVTQLDEAGAGVRVMLSMLDTAVADPNSLDERTCLLLGLMLRRIELRDRAWMLINPANADDHVRLWGAVVARVPPTLAAAPLCLLGMAAWLDGDGARLNCCCGRLAVVAPDYSMGTLLAEISERALPPSIWQELGGEVQGRSQKHPAPLAS